MKAEILTTDYGRHNAAFESASARILEGATWKKQRIIVLIPSAKMIPAKVALSHWNLIFPPNNATFRMLCLGMEVGDAYSQAIESILASPDIQDWEYLLTLEHDNVPPPDGVLKLIEAMDKHPEYDCIGGLYWTKGEGGCPQIWGDPKDPVLNFRPQVPLPDTVQECTGTGMGFNLWRLAMFKDAKLRKPWFKTATSSSTGEAAMSTQDLYAWTDFRKHGYRCAIDTRVKVGHYDAATDISW
jgi:hypothetical protein